MAKRGPAYTYGDPRFDRDTEDGENALLEAKQRELEGVVQRHDALVREAFHLDHFRMLLGYDPEEAKKDTSPVFEEVCGLYCFRYLSLRAHPLSIFVLLRLVTNSAFPSTN